MVELSERSSSKTVANEYTPLTSQVTDRISEALPHPPIASSLLGGAVVGGPDFNDDSLDFFKVICEELNKINNFFIGKLAQLRILLEEITRLVSLLLLYTTNRVALKVLSTTAIHIAMTKIFNSFFYM